MSDTISQEVPELAGFTLEWQTVKISNLPVSCTTPESAPPASDAHWETKAVMSQDNGALAFQMVSYLSG